MKYLLIAVLAFALSGCETATWRGTMTDADRQRLLDTGMKILYPPKQPVYFPPMRQPVTCTATRGPVYTTVNCY